MVGSDPENALVARARRLFGGRLMRNALALMASSGGTSVIGVVFWGVSAHLASATVIGRASAEIAAMVLLANLAELSFGSIFERFLPVTGRRTRELVRRAYYLCTVTALVISAVYVLTGLANSFLPTSLAWRAIFVVSVIMWTIFMLQDSALIGLRASRWVPVENILYALMKLALLPAFLWASTSQGIFLTWMAPVVVFVVGVNRYLFRKRIDEHARSTLSSEPLPTTRELFFLAGAQYSTLLYTVFAPSIVALVVVQRLGAVANAHYYMPALITTGLALVSGSIVRSFIVEAAHEPQRLRHHAVTAAWGLAAILAPSVLLGVIFAPRFLRIFGPAYEADGTMLMRMMLLSLPLTAVATFYAAFAWIDRRLWWLVLRELVNIAVYFSVLLALINRRGIEAIGIAALVSSGLQGLIFLPVTVKRFRQTKGA